MVFREVDFEDLVFGPHEKKNNDKDNAMMKNRDIFIRLILRFFRHNNLDLAQEMRPSMQTNVCARERG